MRSGLRVAIPLLLIGLVGACALSVDSEQLHVCRLVLPALHLEGTVLREIRSAPAALGRAGVRIDYTAQELRQPARNRVAACGFAGSTLTPGRLDLVAVTLDGVPLSEARLLYLKRFWLGGFGATAEEPAI